MYEWSGLRVNKNFPENNNEREPLINLTSPKSPILICILQKFLWFVHFKYNFVRFQKIILKPWNCTKQINKSIIGGNYLIVSYDYIETIIDFVVISKFLVLMEACVLLNAKETTNSYTMKPQQNFHAENDKNCSFNRHHKKCYILQPCTYRKIGFSHQ